MKKLRKRLVQNCSEFAERENNVIRALWRVLYATGAARSSLLLRKAIAVSGLAGLLFGLSGAMVKAEEKQPCSEQMYTAADDKASRTPAQRKLSSELLGGGRRSVQPQPDGTILVDIKADVTDVLLQEIESLGGTVVSHFPKYQAIRAHLPAEQLETLAEWPDVKFIRPADRPQLRE